MFGFLEDLFRDLARPRDLRRSSTRSNMLGGKCSFRESDDSRFVTLALPRVLARMPYGPKTNPPTISPTTKPRGVVNGDLEHDEYCWMNAAYVMGTKLTDAFAKSAGTLSEGLENGGKVENLPMHVFSSDDGGPGSEMLRDRKSASPTAATPNSANSASRCLHYKNTDYAVFFGAQTAHKPKLYDKPEATANAAVSARLPYIMATSRSRIISRSWARQDRLLHGSVRLRSLAQSLDR